MNTFSKTVCMIVACAFAAPNTAQAFNLCFSKNRIKSITLDPAQACLGDEVEVTVEVELKKCYSSQNWKSTSIDGVCFEHDDHYGTSSTQTFTEVFTITAPSLQGIGNVQIKIFEDDDCNSLEDTENARLTVLACPDDGVSCWDLNGDFECNEDEDVNDDQVCDALDCQGEDGEDCTVEQVRGGAEICCGDSCVTIFNGENGQDGEDGEDGEDGQDGEQGEQGIPGTSCVLSRGDAPGCVVITCENGHVQICNGQDGEDGDDCTVSQGDDGCATITCEDETDAVICDGENGVDGVDGTSCYAEQTDTGVIIVCGESEAFVPNGLNCWDLNENGVEDFCLPRLANLLSGDDRVSGLTEDGCPGENGIHVDFKCETPILRTTAALQAAETFATSECSVVMSCEEYLEAYSNATPEQIAETCGFTEDTNGDGEVDVLDCRGQDGQDGSNGSNGGSGSGGSDGSDGSDGTDGADGADGQDGTDGEPCDVVDNADGTCTIQCANSSVTVFNCGAGAEPPADPPADDGPPDLCGNFGGFMFVLAIPLMWGMRYPVRRIRRTG